MPYLNLDLDYFTHPKVTRLESLLERPEAMMFPVKLWCYAGKHFPETGVMEFCSKKDLEKAIGWTGESGKLIDSLLEIGFLEMKGEFFKIHDWKQHAGHLSAFKKRAKTAAKKRWKDYATSKAQACLTNAKGYAPNLSSPILTSPSLTVPKEEKTLVPPVGGTANGSLWKSAEDVIGFLNERTQKHFQSRHPNGDPTKSPTLVHSLLKKGYTLTNMRQVVANRCLKWRDDPKMEEFLRPETLFRPSNFTNYLGELGKGTTHEPVSGML